MKTNEQLRNALIKFQTRGELKECTPYGNGHINDTFLAKYVDKDGKAIDYILQAVNTSVFKNPEKLMENIDLVTEFLRKSENDSRRVLTLVKTADGGCYYKDNDGYFWRVYDFVTDSLCIERPETEKDFYECAYAFGKFQRDLSEFPAETLFEVIPDFHNTEKRYKNFLNAVNKDICGRVKEVEKEINFIIEREKFYSLLLDSHKKSDLPLRVTHNDTKCNNVLLDNESRTALCVIDLDTIMPGFSVNDFGDSIRFGASTAAEDEKDLSKVNIDLKLFETYAKGYLAGCGGRLTKNEIMLLPEGAKMMTIECGMRFLTDYLEGDTYFKTAYKDHNLVRCRTQLKLVSEMEKHFDEMKKIVSEI